MYQFNSTKQFSWSDLEFALQWFLIQISFTSAGNYPVVKILRINRSSRKQVGPTSQRLTPKCKTYFRTEKTCKERVHKIIQSTPYTFLPYLPCATWEATTCENCPAEDTQCIWELEKLLHLYAGKKTEKYSYHSLAWWAAAFVKFYILSGLRCWSKPNRRENRHLCLNRSPFL